MTYQEITREIKAMPRMQRLELMELIVETLRQDEPMPSVGESSQARLRGIAKPDGPAPIDEEIDDIRAQYLLEKHA